MGQTNPPFMSGVPELLLLRLLAQREMYGYELVKSVKLVTDEAILDPEVKAIQQLNRKIVADDRFVSTLLPIGDGLLLVSRRN